MEKRNNTLKKWIVTAIALTGISASVVIKHFQNEDTLWVKKQKSSLMESVTRKIENPEYLQVQNILYETSNDRLISKEEVQEIRRIFNLPENEARNLAEAQSDLYGFLRTHFESGVDFKKLTDRKLMDNLDELSKKYAKNSTVISKDSLDNAISEYIIQGYRGRYFSDVGRSGYSYERPAYEFIRDSFAHNLNFRAFSLPVSSHGSDIDYQKFAQNADIDGDKKITVKETINQMKREFAGLK
ncbi:MAG: hypothetical protein KJ718_03165 [Nanoarchaeota archaeon]|nr:hypothetical protein [Nanoarchaeota archaeon]